MMTFRSADALVIRSIRHTAIPAGRIALFVVFFWFGLLKVLGVSPADPLVSELLLRTMPLVPFTGFRIFFGLYEMAIGGAFLISGFERMAITLLFPHMAATFLPFVFLPDIVWEGVLAPSFAGQYIVKNLVIIALALSLAAHLHPLSAKRVSKAPIKQAF